MSSATEWREIAEWDWVVFTNGRALHCLARVQSSPEEIAEIWGARAITWCGRHGDVWIPGMFVRMGAQRCKQCCSVAGFPQGTGSPKNDKACHPMVKRRLRSLGYVVE